MKSLLLLPMRKPFRIIIGLILAIVAAPTLFLIWTYARDYRPDAPEDLPPVSQVKKISELPDTLSLLTWNIGYAGLGKEMDFFYDGGSRARCSEEETRKNLDEILRMLQNLPPQDFILLQEVDADSRRSYHINEVDRISQAFPDHIGYFCKNYDVDFVPVPVQAPMGKVLSGLLTLSVYPPSASERIPLQGTFGFPTFLFMPDRCFHLMRFPFRGRSLVIIHTHNTAFDDGSQRKAQMAQLRSLALEEYRNGNYVVMGGDFNLNPHGFDAAHIAQPDTAFAVEVPSGWVQFPEGWQFHFDPAVPTNRNVDQPYVPGKTPVTVLDFFITSPNIDCIHHKTYATGFAHSDHQPVGIQIRLIH